MKSAISIRPNPVPDPDELRFEDLETNDFFLSVGGDVLRRKTSSVMFSAVATCVEWCEIPTRAVTRVNVVITWSRSENQS